MIPESPRTHAPLLPTSGGSPEKLKKGASSLATGINMLNELEGAGLLGMPYAIKLGGYYSLCCLGFVGALAGFTGWALAHCMYTYSPTGKRRRVRDNYSSVGKACYGPKGERAVKYVQMVNLTSVGIVYLVLVASTMSPLVDLSNHLTFLNHLSNANQR